MRRSIGLIAIVTILFLFASCKAEKEAVSLTGETRKAQGNEESLDVIEPTSSAPVVNKPITESTTKDKEIEEIVSRVLDELKNTTETPTEKVTLLENKTVALNVATNRGEGTLTITSAKLNYQSGSIAFTYTTSDKEALAPVNKSFRLEGASGTAYKTGTIGGKNNTGIMSFYGITDFSDLSTVTLTYQFKGFDPVTVTFNIPV